MYSQITATVLAIAISFALAVAVGVVVGTAMGVSRTLMNLSEPVVAGLYSTPLLALTPLFIIGLGIGLESKIALIFFVVVFPVIINTTVGVKQVEAEHVEAVLAFGGSEWSVIRRVRLPSAIPYILA
ncbi:MAG: ABC transporter permease, partial [Thermomicrobiales bacterium]